MYTPPLAQAWNPCLTPGHPLRVRLGLLRR
jgi:hypothetical protein